MLSRLKSYLKTKLDTWALSRVLPIIEESYVGKDAVYKAFNELHDLTSAGNPVRRLCTELQSMVLERRKMNEEAKAKLKLFVSYHSVNVGSTEIFMGSQQAYDRGLEEGHKGGRGYLIHSFRLNLQSVIDDIQNSAADYRIKTMAVDLVKELENVFIVPDRLNLPKNIPAIMSRIDISSSGNTVDLEDLTKFIEELSMVHNSKRYSAMLEFIELKTKKATSA